MSDNHRVSTEDALSRLDVIEDYDAGNGPEPCVHTFVQASGALLGAHWSVEDAKALFEEHGVELAGSTATAMHHGLVVSRPTDTGVRPIFFATRRDL